MTLKITKKPAYDTKVWGHPPTPGKRVKHRVLSPEWLYTPILLNNAPFDFIFGVDKLYVFVRESPMMDLIIFIISV